MNNTRIMVLGLLVFFLLSGVGYAKTPGGYFHQADWKRKDIFKELNLTPEQSEKLQANRTQNRQEAMQLRQSMKDKQTALQEALKNPDVTPETVAPMVNEIKSLQSKLIDQRLNGIFAVKDILTPEQFVKFQEMTEKRQLNREKSFESPDRERKWFRHGQDEGMPKE